MSQTQAPRKNLTPAVQVKPSGYNTDATHTDLGGLDKSIVLEGDLSLEELRDSMNANISTHIDSQDFKQFAGNLDFMEERVMVRIMPTAEKNAEQIIDIYNGGVLQMFVRGEWVICKRKYVEVLARAKPFSVATPEVRDGAGGRTTSITTTTGLRYPFEMQDRNPHGEPWLRGILAEA